MPPNCPLSSGSPRISAELFNPFLKNAQLALENKEPGIVARLATTGVIQGRPTARVSSR
jgi:hypothetical protein